jgi:hypothetical protein
MISFLRFSEYDGYLGVLKDIVSEVKEELNQDSNSAFDGEIPTALSYRNELNVHKTLVNAFSLELKSAHDPLSR